MIKARKTIVKTTTVGNNQSGKEAAWICLIWLNCCWSAWRNIVIKITIPNINKSTTRSTTIVPNILSAGTFWYLLKYPALAISPERGMVKFIIYPIITLWYIKFKFGLISSVCNKYFHLYALLKWLKKATSSASRIHK